MRDRRRSGAVAAQTGAVLWAADDRAEVRAHVPGRARRAMPLDERRCRGTTRRCRALRGHRAGRGARSAVGDRGDGRGSEGGHRDGPSDASYSWSRRRQNVSPSAARGR